MQAGDSVRAATEAVEPELGQLSARPAGDMGGVQAARTAGLEQAQRTPGPARAAALASLRQDEPWQAR